MSASGNPVRQIGSKARRRVLWKYASRSLKAKMACPVSAQRQQDRRSLERRNYNDAGSVM